MRFISSWDTLGFSPISRMKLRKKKKRKSIRKYLVVRQWSEVLHII